MHFMQFIDMGYTPLMKVQFNLTRLEELEMNLFYHGREEEAAELDQKEYFHPQSTHEQCSIQIFNGITSKEITFHKNRDDGHKHWKICQSYLDREFPSIGMYPHSLENELCDSQSELDKLEKNAKSEENCLSFLHLLVELWQYDDYVGIECLLQESDLSVPEDIPLNEEFSSLTNMRNIGKDILIFEWC
jgi:hypothetical protein